jgi:hypothetical protein
MADPRVFISFDFDHNENEKNLFAGQAKNSRTPFNIEDWSSKTSLPQSQWEKLIKDKINKCNVLVVLIGKNTSNATGVEKEIAFAVEQNVPIFGIYVGGADINTKLPTGISRSKVIAWIWELIEKAIESAIKDGKNI